MKQKYKIRKYKGKKKKQEQQQANFFLEILLT